MDNCVEKIITGNRLPVFVAVFLKSEFDSCLKNGFEMFKEKSNNNDGPHIYSKRSSSQKIYLALLHMDLVAPD